MKRIYANYCMLETFLVEDDWTDEMIMEKIEEEYNRRGISMEDFDGGEWEEVYEQE